MLRLLDFIQRRTENHEKVSGKSDMNQILILRNNSDSMCKKYV